MWIKKLTLSILLLTLTICSAQASCYTEWLDSFNAAEEELAGDLLRCQNASWPSRCSNEAHLNYGSAIDEAGNEYYDCINRY